MSVAQSISRSVSRSRNTARHVTPNEVRAAQSPIRSAQDAHPAASSIEVADLTVPSQVDPDEQVSGHLTVRLSEPSSGIGVDQPDRCTVSWTGNQGFNVRTGVAFREVPGVDLQTECMDAPSQAEETIGHEKFTEQSFSLQAPHDPGEYDLEVVLSGADSGLIMDQQFRPITVRGDNGDSGDGGDNGDNGGGGVWSNLLGVMRQLLDTVGSGFETLGEAIRTVGGVLNNAIDSVRELLVRAGSAIRDVAVRAASFVADRPLLLFVIIMATFGVAPALGETLLSFTPVGVAREIVPFIG